MNQPDTPETADTTAVSPDRYIAPTRSDRAFAPLVSGLIKMGVGIRGGRILHVRGRKSGTWYTNPVNPLHLGGETYLVAPRGRTGWVRNLRVSQEGRLQKGRRYEDFSAVELDDADKGPIIREYLRLWSMETGRFFDGLTKDSTDAEITAIAPGFPVFRISTVTA